MSEMRDLEGVGVDCLLGEVELVVVEVRALRFEGDSVEAEVEVGGSGKSCGWLRVATMLLEVTAVV